jgi:hypothetical protein
MSSFNEALIRNAQAGNDVAQDNPIEVEIEEQEVQAEEAIEPNDELLPQEDAAEEVVQEEEEALVEESPKEDEDAEQFISDWDALDSESLSDTKSNEIDFKSIAGEIGIQAEGKDDFIAKINELKAKAEAEVENPIDSLPENLKKAIDVAKNDGDYMEYLGVTSVNYDAYPNEDIVKNHYANILRNADGTVDIAQVEMILDGMTEAEINVKGIELKNGLKIQQEQRARAIEAEAAQRRVEADKELRAALDGVTDHRGFKLTATHKKQMYEGITSGDIIKQMFHGRDGKMDWDKVINNYANFLYGERQVQFLKQQVASQTKKEVLNRLSNKSVEPKPTASPNVSDPNKKKTAQEILAEQLREQGANLFRPS